MFYHIVLMTFGPHCGPDFFAKAERYVARVNAECEGVVTYFMERNCASRNDGYTHGIVGVFASSKAHDVYQVSPVHVEMKDFMQTGMTRILVLDAVHPA